MIVGYLLKRIVVGTQTVLPANVSGFRARDALGLG